MGKEACPNPYLTQRSRSLFSTVSTPQTARVRSSVRRVRLSSPASMMSSRRKSTMFDKLCTGAHFIYRFCLGNSKDWVSTLLTTGVPARIIRIGMASGLPPHGSSPAGVHPTTEWPGAEGRSLSHQPYAGCLPSEQSATARNVRARCSLRELRRDATCTFCAAGFPSGGTAELALSAQR